MNLYENLPEVSKNLHNSVRDGKGKSAMAGTTVFTTAAGRTDLIRPTTKIVDAPEQPHGSRRPSILPYMIPRSLTTKTTVSTTTTAKPPTQQQVPPPTVLTNQSNAPLQRVADSERVNSQHHHLAGTATELSKLEDFVVCADIEDLYDPFQPNSFDTYLEEQKRMASSVDSALMREPAARVRNQPLADPKVPSEPTTITATTSVTSYPDAPPTSSFGERILYKQGWKGSGFGLGKDDQGIQAPLEHQVISEGSKDGSLFSSGVGTAAIGMIVQAAPLNTREHSRVVVLTNMVDRAQVDPELSQETAEECKTFGDVLSCVVYEGLGEADEDQEVRIFVMFGRVQAAKRAKKELHDRYFAGRKVCATMYPECAFLEKQYRLPLK